MEKKDIRREMRAVKAQQSSADWAQWSASICSRIEALPEFKNARSVLFYSSLPDEVETHTAMRRWAADKVIYLPVVTGRDLRIAKYVGDENMKAESCFGILEPTSSDDVSLADIDLAIIPGVAFDRQCNRLGRGKGYYDRLLSEGGIKKIGICFEFQLLDKIPVYDTDVPLDMVVTEKNVYKR